MSERTEEADVKVVPILLRFERPTASDLAVESVIWPGVPRGREIVRHVVIRSRCIRPEGLGEVLDSG